MCRCAVVWRIEKFADTASLQGVLEDHGGKGYILIWVDLMEEVEPERLGDWLKDEVLDVDNNYKVVLLLTTGESDELQDAALKLSKQLQFEAFAILAVKEASVSLGKTDTLHKDIRLSFTEETEQCSAFELLDEVGEATFAGLVAKELPGIISGDDSEIETQEVPIAGMYVDGTDLIFTVCVLDIGFLKNLNYAVLTGFLDQKLGESLSRTLGLDRNGGVMISGGNMGQAVGMIAKPRSITVETDMSHFAETFEHAILALDKLTVHQTAKLEELRGQDRVHLYAPAGAGKTFVALHMILQALFVPSGDEAEHVRVLFVAKNEALALFVVKWLLVRCEGEDQKRRMLESLHILYQPSDATAPREMVLMKATLNDGRLSTEAVERAEKYDIEVVDEAHHVYSDASVRVEVEKYTAPLLASCLPDSPGPGFPRLLILSDLSQSADIEKAVFPVGLHDVYLTEVVRSSQRILAGASAFQLNAAHDEETESQHQADGPPLKSLIFEFETGAGVIERYVDQTVQALLHHVAATFPGLGFHDRVAIIVPHAGFRDQFRAALERKGLSTRLQEQVAELKERRDAGRLGEKDKQRLEELLKKVQGVSGRRFRVVDAAEASRCVSERNARVEDEMIVVMPRLTSTRPAIHVVSAL